MIDNPNEQIPFGTGSDHDLWLKMKTIDANKEIIVKAIGNGTLTKQELHNMDGEKLQEWVEGRQYGK